MKTSVGRFGLTILWFLGLALAIAVSIRFALHPGPINGEFRFQRWVQSLPIATATEIGNDLAYSHVSVPIGTGLAIVALLRRRFDLSLLLALPGLIRITNGLIKDLVERPRPTAEQVRITDHASGFSFPSGHTFGAALLFGAMILCLWRLPLPRLFRIGGTILLLFLIALCGIARIYVGAHWPTDVGGAWLIAALWIGLLAKIADLISLRFGPMDHF
ncbi:phosphatase PAP2 family protein [soil metagenome]